MTSGTVTQTVWSLTEDSGDRVVQDQAGLRLRRGRDTIPIVELLHLGALYKYITKCNENSN